MKKLLFIFSCILLTLSSCSDDLTDGISTGEVHPTSNQVRWYGAKSPSGIQSFGVSDGSKRWNQDAGIYIKFINSPSDPSFIEKIKTIASEWEQYAGIKFHFVEAGQKADVRIAFDWNGNDWLTWSYTGNDAKKISDQAQPTAVFGGLQYQDEQQFKGDVLRVFGQILGLEYEQRHQQWTENGYWRNPEKLQAYWEDFFDGYTMDWAEIRQYVFDPLTSENTLQLLETKELDEASVMAWPYYVRSQTLKLLANYELSEGDKTFIAKLYPKNGSESGSESGSENGSENSTTSNTIQKAWVDAGYFVWNYDDGEVSLRITALGQQQEYLPDVSDGEQLTSAKQMFYGATKLKKAPMFNTKNIIKFTYMFAYCTSLTSIPLYNTSKANGFSSMFSNCTSLTSIPKLDTSNGIDFASMFAGATSLASIPNLDTSKGTYFQYMFKETTSLKTIPLLDTSKGTLFYYMFAGAKSLISVPNLNTSKGTNFGSMFRNCTSLTSIPKLETSNGYYFDYMFAGAISLTFVPNLNTSIGNNLSYMFLNCRSLKTKPELNIKTTANINDMYTGTPFA
ncbi:BspA family leucine-rich repeat surface protein [Apibacter muscae]|uniref:BspA family leucine-rich repeat surface protein n=1 Tax=Apibacter muscae TaxID=2509004 RepID=A0A563DE15_9FLAO|nr:BspA family leucine-rich repeat surface protein [Apibacter muscae]TWP28446.1 BspA family leucine-rich repeat surface protein [Apibacter muscae]